ncbi:MAG TPA: FlgD immunoglobulin-like domain containing protein, partial [bacterium]|nr:FlgD immunoglobulin-like domain containing protein [bacterium]
TGGAPCCGGGGGNGPMMALQPLVGNVAAPEVNPNALSSAQKSLPGEWGATSSPTSTPTPTLAPEGVQSIVAAPNVSRNGQPVKFLVNLNQPASIRLAIFTVSGEEVYSAQSQGSQGLNTLVWEIRNNSGNSVASGLYLYVLRASGGVNTGTKTGKIAILK